MGRDDNPTSRGKRHLAQTPKQQISDGIDVEFSKEYADHDDKVAHARRKQADKRN